MNSINTKLAFIIMCCFLFSCTKKNAEPEAETPQNIEIEIIEEEPFSLNFPKIKYKFVEIESNKHLNEIKNKYKNDPILGAAYRKALRTLNRREIRFFRVGQTIIVPDSAIADMRAYSIFPDEYKAAKDLDHIIMIDVQYQCYGCYEYGKLVRFAATNTGYEGSQTEPGKYYFNWKKKEHKSTYDSTWIMPYTFNMHKFGTAMHQYAMPGRPVSKSCLRQFEDDAAWIFYWGRMNKRDADGNVIINSGTPVIVLNRFDFSITTGGPWLNLTSNKCYYTKLPDNPMDVPDAIITRKQPPIQQRNIATKEVDTNSSAAPNDVNVDVD